MGALTHLAAFMLGGAMAVAAMAVLLSGRD